MEIYISRRNESRDDLFSVRDVGERVCENHDMIMVPMANASKKWSRAHYDKVVSFVSFLSSPPDSFEVLSTQREKSSYPILSYPIPTNYRP
jgi:hypothetical protein